MPGKRNLTVDEAFWAKVSKTDVCWNWTGTRITDKGVKSYGLLCFMSSHYVAHRFSYIIHGGSIPGGMELDHLCKNKACVNPEHLEVVTRSENMRRNALAMAAFCKRGHPRTGPGHHCEICDAMSKSRWYEDNKERAKKQIRQHYIKNREKFLQRARDQRERNRLLKHQSSSPGEVSNNGVSM